MKVLQVNVVHRAKSTGRTCAEAKRALEEKGHAGYVAYGRGRHNEENTHRIGTEADYYHHNIMARLTGFQGYYSKGATKKFIKYIEKISPDIIHLRNLHSNFLNMPLFFDFLARAGVPVILNLHDCWPFTARCAHYTDNRCTQWKTGCRRCRRKNLVSKSVFFDHSAKLYRDKKKWFSAIPDLTVVGVSRWTAEQAKMSFLANREIHTIYNWIDRDVFYPRQGKVMEKHGLDPSRFTIIGVSAGWSAGSPRCRDMLQLAGMVPDDTQIVLVGHSKITDFSPNIRHIPYVEDMNELAELYSSADAYVHLSTEDTFGKVVVEAMACGTPVIVYNSTALPELVPEGCGHIVDPRDLSGVIAALERIKSNGRASYSAMCVENVKRNFDFGTNTRQLISLYESIANRRSE